MSDSQPEQSDLPEELVSLARTLLLACRTSPIMNIASLLEQGAPAWYQDEALGWSALHYAAERRHPELLEILLRGGAVWNAIDKWGRTAGEICLSLGDQEGWKVIRNEGIRSEMLHHALAGSSSGAANLTLRAEDATSAGNNMAFLQSKLSWDVGEDGKQRVLDEDGNGVMMGWEEPLMQEHVKLMCYNHPSTNDGQGLRILNIGYGLGTIDRLFHRLSPPPAKHTIIEAHPSVLRHMTDTRVSSLPNIHILEGQWQDWLSGDKLGKVLEMSGGGFDVVFIDTFAEGYEDLKAFFEILLDILEPEHGVFSFWNGLGATSECEVDNTIPNSTSPLRR